MGQGEGGRKWDGALGPHGCLFRGLTAVHACFIIYRCYQQATANPPPRSARRPPRRASLAPSRVGGSVTEPLWDSFQVPSGFFFAKKSGYVAGAAEVSLVQRWNYSSTNKG